VEFWERCFLGRGYNKYKELNETGAFLVFSREAGRPIRLRKGR
jgi:hypothetical protein